MWNTLAREHVFSTQHMRFSRPKIFTDSFWSDTTFPFSINVILSYFNVSSVRHGFTVFQFCLLSVTRLISRLLKKSFLIFHNNLTWIFRCFLYAACDDIVLSCLNLFNNLDFISIAFIKFMSVKYILSSNLKESRCLVWVFFDRIRSEDHF